MTPTVRVVASVQHSPGGDSLQRWSGAVRQIDAGFPLTNAGRDPRGLTNLLSHIGKSFRESSFRAPSELPLAVVNNTLRLANENTWNRTQLTSHVSG